MISISHAGHRVHIRPGVHVGARAFAVNEEGVIQQEHTHGFDKDTITIVRFADGECIPLFACEIIEEGHKMIDYTRRGEHIHMKGVTRTHLHTFDGSEHGIVLGETDNGLGQRLMSVDWQGGDWGPVFSEEVELDPTEGPP